MKKRIMILGAGIYQVPLIKKAREMGLESVVVSTKGKYPGIPLSDVFLEADTTDISAVLSIAKKFKVQAALTTGSDVAVPAIGAIVDEMKLVGTGYEAALISMDKTLMKEAFAKFNVPSALFMVVNSMDEALYAVKKIGLPVMVKTVDSSGSRGITKITNETDIPDAWRYAVSVSKSEKVIIEKFLDGIEFGAQAIVSGNLVVDVFIHNDQVTSPPYMTPIGHSMPADFDELIKNKILACVQRVVSALGICDTIANVDLMLVNGEPVIIEIGARMGATCLPENISIYGGFDAYEYIINLALGMWPQLPERYPRQPNAALLFQSTETGILESINVPEEVLNHRKVHKITIDKKPGDRVERFEVGPHRIGDIVVTGDDAREAEKLARELADMIEIRIKKEK
jgi:biotin carboxylase